MSYVQNTSGGASNDETPSPKVVKKMEKEINKEAKYEERNVKGAVKDLAKTQKAEALAQKDASKADKTLSKLQKTEQDTLKNLYKAQEKHDVALAKLHKAEQDLELSKRNHAQLQGAVQSKNVNVEGVMKQHEDNTQARNERLKSLHAVRDENANSESPTAGV